MVGAGGYTDGRYDNLVCVGYFYDGSTYTWEGRPWGSSWEQFKAMLQDNAMYVEMNMNGNFWQFR
jgi:hypothetical protein